MKSAKKAVYDILSSDDTLLALLAQNAPYYDPKGTQNTLNSVLPASKATSTTKTPFIQIQSGPRVKIDSMGNMYDEFFYIRCYNDIEKAYVEIDNIIERIELLLDDTSLTLADGTNVKTTLEDVDMEREDETLELNYKEARFRVRLVQ